MSLCRYYVDERDGCIAVVDQDADADNQELTPNAAGVVWYEHGVRNFTVCPTCHHQRADGWKLKPGARERADAVCAELNAASQKPHDAAGEIT